jgi:hypothetical protein
VSTAQQTALGNTIYTALSRVLLEELNSYKGPLYMYVYVSSRINSYSAGRMANINHSPRLTAGRLQFIVKAIHSITIMPHTYIHSFGSEINEDKVTATHHATSEWF